jgi:hypothetical protein
MKVKRRAYSNATAGRGLQGVMHTIIAASCGLVVRVPGYISRDPGSIPGAARFSEK